MLEIKNHTYFETGLAPATDRDGLEYAVLAIKGTFDIPANGGAATFAAEQQPCLPADEHFGEPGFSSVRFEMDSCLRKPGTDVVLVGDARPKQTARRIDVGLQAGPIRKVVRVFGDRRWERSLGRWRMSDPEPFDEMPLVWERAFGGRDETHEKEKKHGFEPRNPVGAGFAAGRGSDRLEGLALPNLEDPKQLIESWKDRPAPAGFGFTGRHWEPRVRYAGTFDEAWEKERCPLLPADFDERFFNGAPGGQVARHFTGGEPVRLVNVANPHGASELRFELPRDEFEVTARIKGADAGAAAVLDTVVLEPGAGRVLMTWRATIPCPRAFLYVEHVRIRRRRS